MSNLKAARARLTRIETDLLGYFKVMGAAARALDGKDRLEVLHGIMHPDGERFSFDWNWLAPSGLSTKDFIAPSSFAFKNSRMFQMGGKLCAVSFLQIITPELNDHVLTDFLDTDSGIVVNLHVQALDQSEAVKMIKSISGFAALTGHIACGNGMCSCAERGSITPFVSTMNRPRSVCLPTQWYCPA